jgi:hypothetical protein
VAYDVGPLGAVTMRFVALAILVGVGAAVFVGGCSRTLQERAAQPAAARELGLAAPAMIEPVSALATPPQGWSAEPLKQSDRHAHQVWLSPTGKTAYGIIHFVLPGFADVFAVPMDWVLRGFLDEMRKDQGEATLISKVRDDNLPGMRFVAEGGLYRTYTNLIVAGRHGWAIYAGVLRAKPVAPEELELAEHAREQTLVRAPE